MTIDIQDKLRLFGDIKNGKMELSEMGWQIEKAIREIPKYYSGIEMDRYAVMPDHIHMIIKIRRIWESARTNKMVGVDSNIDPIMMANPGRGRIWESARTKNLSLSEVIQRFKIYTTNIYINGVRRNNWPKFNKRLWQRNYYESIIRSEDGLEKIREYIKANPRNWKNQ